MKRRHVLTGLASTWLLGAPALVRAQQSSAQVVIVGGGFGGATVARYLRSHHPHVRITLVEPLSQYHTCPFSNLVLAGERTLDSIAHGYQDLRKAQIEVIHSYADAVDTHAKTVRLRNGKTLRYDKLVVAPGVDMRWNALQGYDEKAAELAPHAWKAGKQTQLLRQQLQAMRDGGTFVMTIPANPFRCPPGPYERAGLIAHYFKKHKPRSKILLLDAKDEFSKKALFMQGWKALYGDMIEWVGQKDDGEVVRVHAAAREVETAFGQTHRADVLNVIPPQQAGYIARQAGLTNSSGWVPIVGDTFATTASPDVFALGDATIAAPMPKSAFSANTQGKLVAAVINAQLRDQPLPTAHFANTCYSLVGPDYGISVAGVYQTEEGKVVEIPGTGGVSPLQEDADFRHREALYAQGWYNAITRDIWGHA